MHKLKLFLLLISHYISFWYTAAVGITSPLPSNIPMPTPGLSSDDASKWLSVESTTLYMKQGFLTLHCTCMLIVLVGLLGLQVSARM